MQIPRYDAGMKHSRRWIDVTLVVIIAAAALWVLHNKPGCDDCKVHYIDIPTETLRSGPVHCPDGYVLGDVNPSTNTYRCWEIQ